jgi:hypothetical protein
MNPFEAKSPSAVGMNPKVKRHPRNRASLRSVVVLVIASIFSWGIPAYAQNEARVKIGVSGSLGMPPDNFEFSLRGEGEPGTWKVVRDETAADGAAIEHVSTDQHDDRFPLAIYKPLRPENVEVELRFKIISGTMQAAGVAVGLRDLDSFYAISASAIEHRVALLLFKPDSIEQIESAEAEIALNRWYVLKVVANDDHFAVSLDQRILFTTFDRTRMKDGRVALLTQEDNVTRFDHLEIRPLPPTEWR